MTDIQIAIDIIEDMIEALKPLEIKYPGDYEKRIGVLNVALRSIQEAIEHEAPAPQPPAIDPSANYELRENADGTRNWYRRETPDGTP